MVSKSTSILLAVAVVAVSAVAIIGLGYAYTASTDNSGNSAEVKYITLSQTAYADNFDKKIVYDTANPSGTTTYTLHAGQEVTIVAAHDEVPAVKGVLLGSTAITVGMDGNNGDSFKFSVEKTVGTMTGTFYIGYIVDGGAEVIRAYTNGSVNYYKTGSDGAAVTDVANATSFTADSITVKLYYSFSTAALEEAPSDAPLAGVTFQFKATAPDA